MILSAKCRKNCFNFMQKQAQYVIWGGKKDDWSWCLFIQAKRREMIHNNRSWNEHGRRIHIHNQDRHSNAKTYVKWRPEDESLSTQIEYVSVEWGQLNSIDWTSEGSRAQHKHEEFWWKLSTSTSTKKAAVIKSDAEVGMQMWRGKEKKVKVSLSVHSAIIS